VVEINKNWHSFQESRRRKGIGCGGSCTYRKIRKTLWGHAFEEAVDVYKEQVKGLLEGGVDFFVIETMMDIQEARAALLAVKESCDLPVCVSMTFDESGRTLTGTDSVSALIILQSLGADVVDATVPQDRKT